MAATFLQIPPASAGGGILTVTTASDLPATGEAGDVYLILDTGRLVYWRELDSTWDNIDADISTISIDDTNSVDLAISSGKLIATLKLSAAAAAAGNFLAGVSVVSDGLKVQVPESGIRSTPLTGLAGANGQLAATDTVLGAFDKLKSHQATQDQIIADTNEPSGHVNQTDSEFSFDNITRTFAIQPKSPATSFRFWCRGVEFSKNSAQTIVIPDTDSAAFIYFDATGTIAQLSSFDLSLIRGLGYTATMVWHTERKELIYLGEERHGLTMDNSTHEYLHTTHGTQYESGLGLGNFPAGDSPSGALAASAQFSVADGVIADEDIRLAIANGAPQTLSTVAEIPMFYREGASGRWNNNYCSRQWGAGAAYTVGMKVRAATGDQRRVFTVTVAGTSGGSEPSWPATIGGTVADGGVTWQYTGNLQYAVKNFLTTPFRAAYNQFTGGAWQQTDVGQANFVLTHIFATNDVRHPIIAIQGQAVYSTVANARTGANTEIKNLVTSGLPFQEFVAVATLIFQTSSTFSNLVHSRLRQEDTSTGSWYVRWVGEKISPTQSPTAHPNLTGLDVANQHPVSVLVPTVDGSSAAAGRVGEILTISQTTLTTTGVGASGQWGDIGSQAVSAGEYLVIGVAEIDENGSSISADIEFGIGTVAGNTAPAYSDFARFPFLLVGMPKVPIPAVLLSLNAASTIYLKSKATYTGGTPKHAGVAKILRICK